MAIISLGKLDKSLIPMIIGCVFTFLNRLLNQYKGTLLFKNAILSNIVFSFARFLAIIPYIIVQVRTNNFKNTKNRNDDNNLMKYISRDFKDNKKDIFKGKTIYIILASLTFFVQSILFVLTFEIKASSWIWYILIASLFYYFIFKVKLYKHHYLSILLIIVIGFIIDFATGNLVNDIKNNFGLLLLRFLREILFSFHNVLAKYIMEKKYISVYFFTFTDGIINIILLIIVGLIDYYCTGYNDYDEYFNNFNNSELFVLLGGIITQFGVIIFLYITIKNNTPSHAFIILAFGQFAYIYSSGLTALVIICLIFILFLSLVIIEIIEINFCGLSYNIKRNIILRAENDVHVSDSKPRNESAEKIETNGYLINLSDIDSEN